MVTVTVDTSKTLIGNIFKLGFQEDWNWMGLITNSTRQQLIRDADFKFIRIFEGRYQTNASPDPCISWNDATKTGVFNWTDLDNLMRAIFNLGAEPILCFGMYKMDIQYLPNGMGHNPTTNLPYPDNYGAYCAEYVKHFKEVGIPVRIYQIVNEIGPYLVWPYTNWQRNHNYIELFNACWNAMKTENPDIMISFDCSTRIGMLDQLVNEAIGLDYLDFHKYDEDTIPNPMTIPQIFNKAESLYLTSNSSSTYSVDAARQKWFNSRGEWLPIMSSESNLNSGHDPHTDVYIQQMVGAVWYALVMRLGILKQMETIIWYDFSGGSITDRGFSMVNGNNAPWYPYFVARMIGTNLNIGNEVVESISSSSNIRTLAWINGTTLNLLLIKKSTGATSIDLSGITGELKFTKIDETYPETDAQMQEGIINTVNPLILNGYTVILLQGQISEPTTYKLQVSSTPINAPFTINGVPHPSGSEITVPEGEELIISVPEKIVEA